MIDEEALESEDCGWYDFIFGGPVTEEEEDACTRYEVWMRRKNCS